MKLLVPVDGSEDSMRALDFAIEMAGAFDATLHVVHFSDAETEATDSILEHVRETLAAAGVDDRPELVVAADEFRRGKSVGEAVLEYVEREGFDHVVMGHHSAGRVERTILGSAAETVVHSESVSVTVVP